MRHKPSEALTQSSKLFPRSFWIMLVIVATINTAGALFSYQGFDHSSQNGKLRFLQTVVVPNLVLGTTASLAASFIYLALCKSNAQEKLEIIQKSAPLPLLQETLDDLDFYKRHVCENWNVRASLRRHASGAYLTCVMEHSFRKTLPGPQAFLRIKRNDKTNGVLWPSSFSQLCLSSLFIWSADESSFPRAPEDGDYLITDFRIDSETIDLKRIESTPHLLTFEAQIPQHLQDHELHHISFAVTIPVENSSAISVNHQWPTRGSVVSFNYTSVDDIDVVGFDFTGMKSEPDLKSTKMEITYEFPNRWALPRSGYCFVWWQRTRQLISLQDLRNDDFVKDDSGGVLQSENNVLQKKLERP